MSNLNKKQTAFMATQKNLIDLIEEQEMVLNLDVAVAIRRALSEAIKESGISRGEVAGRMSDYLGRAITADMLNAWSAESKEGHRLPAEYVPALCHATHNYELLAVLCGALRAQVVLPEDAEDARVLMAEIELRKMQRKVDEMKRAQARRRGV